MVAHNHWIPPPKKDLPIWVQYEIWPMTWAILAIPAIPVPSFRLWKHLQCFLGQAASVQRLRFRGATIHREAGHVMEIGEFHERWHVNSWNLSKTKSWNSRQVLPSRKDTRIFQAFEGYIVVISGSVNGKEVVSQWWKMSEWWVVNLELWKPESICIELLSTHPPDIPSVA